MRRPLSRLLRHERLTIVVVWCLLVLLIFYFALPNAQLR